MSFNDPISINEIRRIVYEGAKGGQGRMVREHISGASRQALECQRLGTVLHDFAENHFAAKLAEVGDNVELRKAVEAAKKRVIETGLRDNPLRGVKTPIEYLKTVFPKLQDDAAAEALIKAGKRADMLSKGVTALSALGGGAAGLAITERLSRKLTGFRRKAAITLGTLGGATLGGVAGHAISLRTIMANVVNKIPR